MKTFKDIEFLQNPYKNGWHGTLKLGDYTLSVVASEYAYSKPRAYLMHVEDYSKFEVAVMGQKDFATKEIFPNEMDDVISYQTREEINDIIKSVIDYEKAKSN